MKKSFQNKTKHVFKTVSQFKRGDLVRFDLQYYTWAKENDLTLYLYKHPNPDLNDGEGKSYCVYKSVLEVLDSNTCWVPAYKMYLLGCRGSNVVDVNQATPIHTLDNHWDFALK